VGQSTVYGELVKYFKGDIPPNVFKWDNPYKKEYSFYFIVPEQDIERAREQCAEIELRDFTILSNKGMIIGG